LKLLNIIFTLVLAVLFAGCATKSSYTPSFGVSEISSEATYSIGKVEDLSGFKFDESDNNSFNLSEAMEQAIKTELNASEILDNPGQYAINANITSYAPGNAFARWLLPGAGATNLSVECDIVDASGIQYAKISVERTIAAGGLFSVGAWKNVFNEVAKEIVTILKDPKRKNKQE
jgi:hypothetical protein